MQHKNVDVELPVMGRVGHSPYFHPRQLVCEVLRKDGHQCNPMHAITVHTTQTWNNFNVHPVYRMVRMDEGADCGLSGVSQICTDIAIVKVGDQRAGQATHLAAVTSVLVVPSDNLSVLNQVLPPTHP